MFNALVAEARDACGKADDETGVVVIVVVGVDTCGGDDTLD